MSIQANRLINLSMGWQIAQAAAEFAFDLGPFA
jgi:hypothetical protein